MKSREMKKTRISNLDEASAIVKKHAKKQQVRINLTPEQAEAIQKQWKTKNPRKPTQLIFIVNKKSIIDLQVAGYSYRGDTCCA